MGKEKALKELMDIMRDGMSKAYYEGYSSGFEHKNQLEVVEALKDLLEKETI